jgi:hypothetical protein
VCETVKELKLPWTELKAVITDGAPSVTGRKSGLMGRIWREMDEIPNFIRNFTESSTNSLLVEKFLSMNML